MPVRPVSDRFLRTIRGSHQAVAEAYVVEAGQTGTSPTGTKIPILGGDVRFNSTANIWGTLSLTTEGKDMWPSAGNSLLAPYGNEVWVRRGVAFGGGSVEWVSLGYYRINTPEQDRAPDGPITLDCQDRMAGIVDGRLVTPIQWAADETYGDVVAHLVTEVYPWADIEWDDTTNTEEVGRSVIVEDDRYKFLNELVKSVGKIWYWDHRGVLIIRSPPSPGDPVWDVDYGEGGVLVELSRKLSRVGVYNAVIASGEATDASTPARAIVVDNNPASPTYWLGSFGKVPKPFSSSFITSDGQAEAAATSMLTQSIGLPYSVDFTAVPNPALEPFDPVLVRYPGRSEHHVIESLTVPLTVEQPLTSTTREKTTVIVGPP